MPENQDPGAAFANDVVAKKLIAKNKGWIGVDLDGTLAHYDHWRGAAHVGEPIVPMLERVKEWIAAGFKVKIFTARVHAEPEVSVPVIQAWCKKHGLPELEVTNVKDMDMLEFWDDRAVQVVRNEGIPVTLPAVHALQIAEQTVLQLFKLGPPAKVTDILAPLCQALGIPIVEISEEKKIILPGNKKLIVPGK